jgi:hypothetical protein
LLCTTNWGGHLGSFQLGGGRWFAVATSAFLAKFHDEVEVEMGEESKKWPIWDPNNRRLMLPDA